MKMKYFKSYKKRLIVLKINNKNILSQLNKMIYKQRVKKINLTNHKRIKKNYLQKI